MHIPGLTVTHAAAASAGVLRFWGAPFVCASLRRAEYPRWPPRPYPQDEDAGKPNSRNHETTKARNHESTKTIRSE
jgi:hypothetical protein